jgi:hypothetical protein
LFGSFAVVVQKVGDAVGQAVCVVEQVCTQALFEHSSPGAHCLPQAPQLFGSVESVAQ